MNAYFTNGTTEFLRQLKHKEQAKIWVFEGEGALAYTEDPHAAKFATPRTYEHVTGTGDIPDDGYIAINNIPVTDEGRPIFEDVFKQRAGKIDQTPGFHALRVLRPQSGNTYLVLTAWEDKQRFEDWKKSEAFQHAHKKDDKQPKRPPFSAGPAYVTTYHIDNEE
ncbi:antibiotic biosynthesis monooxygenase [Terribacillus saccharophilus]|uniref:antibiotic biosynthesis monooxygenase family protein n=1 Tax=Terribacillus saccharophilus TaxID=361277 RepID=UPI003982AC1A